MSALLYDSSPYEMMDTSYNSLNTSFTDFSITPPYHHSTDKMFHYSSNALNDSEMNYHNYKDTGYELDLEITSQRLERSPKYLMALKWSFIVVNFLFVLATLIVFIIYVGKINNLEKQNTITRASKVESSIGF